MKKVLLVGLIIFQSFSCFAAKNEDVLLPVVNKLIDNNEINRKDLIKLVDNQEKNRQDLVKIINEQNKIVVKQCKRKGIKTWFTGEK